MKQLFRFLPAVDACLDALNAQLPASREAPRPLVRHLVNAFLDMQRCRIQEGAMAEPAQLALPGCLPALKDFVREGLRPRLRHVLNATGVVIHTNMGRSVLARTAREAVARTAAGYNNLELDLATGERGSRHSLIEELLCMVTGAEAGLVVNNNAAAVLLILDSVCKGGEVIISRGQLVEIGGSFRIPDVMERSGAILREVGATNRCHLYDYSRAINANTRALLRVHSSNYRIVGFFKEVSLPELVQLGREHSLPVIEDLGSGSLIDFSAFGLPGEPTVQSVVSEGADLVSFSGDKALGGPQAGIIVGKRMYIEQLRVNPLHRALRIDKLTLAALEATLRLYLDPQRALAQIPTVAMLSCPPATLARRARSLASRLRRALGSAAHVSLVKNVSRAGGGAFPARDLPTSLVCLRPTACSAEDLKRRLLSAVPPLMGRLEEGAFCLDPRTLDAKELPLVARVIQQALRQEKETL
ncbi:MAG: L-seryl-tRNA(Sec) selenium transferase [Deltaproteobacteria bacterium]|jgi:L-seryl-tRNA(Ser) seleniumtransferase|nr:L-seryl-tRNA(Sec) selenium transferase [Deltaproteobacteria bacterium]